MAEDQSKMPQQWMDILNNTRENYLKTVNTLSKMQKEFEKVIIAISDQNKDYTDETIKAIKTWVEKGNKVREDFQKIVEDGFKRTLVLFPESINNPFKNQFEDLFKNIQSNFKTIFENFNSTWLSK